MVFWGIIFQPTTELRAGPQSIAMLKVWGEDKEPAKEYEKERSRRWEESQESVVSWRLSEKSVLKWGSDQLKLKMSANLLLLNS